MVSPLQKQRIPELHEVMYHYSIGLPPQGRYHIDVDPTELCLRNHSIKGTLSGTLADITETLDFAQRGQYSLLLDSSKGMMGGLTGRQESFVWSRQWLA